MKKFMLTMFLICMNKSHSYINYDVIKMISELSIVKLTLTDICILLHMIIRLIFTVSKISVWLLTTYVENSVTFDINSSILFE